MGLVFAEPHDTQTYSDTAALLLAMAEEQGLHVRVVQTVLGGFLVPDSISDLLDVTKTPPAWWSEPLEEPNVIFEDGKYLVEPGTELGNGPALPEDGKPFYDELGEAVLAFTEGAASGDREAIRTWAKENGYEVADKGRLKASIVEAFYAAHSES